MVAIVGLIFGALLGAIRAKRRGGSLADILQYAAVHGMILAIAALLAGIIISRNGWL